MVYNLLSGLSIVQANDDQIVFFSNDPINDREKFDGIDYKIVSRHRSSNRFLEETLFMHKHRDEFDSMLFPNYFTPPARRRAKIVTVIHDLQYLHFPDNFGRKKCLWLRAAHELTLRRADEVIAISEFVKHDMVTRYGEGFAGKIRVIPNPVSWERLEVPCDANDADRISKSPYILSVAAHYAHKNLETLIRAFARVNQVNKDYKLVLVGQLSNRLVGIARHARVDEWIRELGLEGAVQVTGRVSDALLGALYRGASLFVLPSLFEGFGMPPVEAIGLGLPVVTTRCASLPEATMGLATYVDDPLDVDELAERIIAILSAPSAHLPSEEGRQKLRQAYSPETVARAYYSALV